MRLITLVLAGAWFATAQPAPDWRKVGGTGVELGLASPATGPVDRVWFSPGGSVLYARTHAGLVFETADFEHWSQTQNPVEAPSPINAATMRLPAPGARVVAGSFGFSRIYAVGRHLWASEDGGRTWQNLTAYKSQSIVGSGQHSVAVSPTDPAQLVLANDYGVWRSLDGGLSWNGLNLLLPNLSVRRILAGPGSSGGVRVESEDFGALELPAGGTVWAPAAAPELEDEASAKSRLSTQLRTEITAYGTSGDTVYAGAEDGRVWVSVDGGRTFPTWSQAGAGRIQRIFVDPKAARVALAALAGPGTRIARTTNTGLFWDSLDANLPEADVFAVTGDRATGAVYAATGKGLFYAYTDLENASVPNLSWAPLTGGLPAGPVRDVRLDPAAGRLYLAVAGYGVYAGAAPHRLRNLRVVNAADFSARAAAPGSLLTVVGADVSAARSGNLNYPVLAVLNSESQIQVPFEATGPDVSVDLETSSGRVSRGVAVQPVSPAVFVGRDGTPWVYDGDSGQQFDSRNPAKPGSRIQIMTTGLGKVRPEWPTGMAAPLENPPEVVAMVRAYLNGTPLEVTRATLAPGYVGFYIIEVELPSLLNAGPSELYLIADGQESNRVKIVIEP